MASHRRTMVLVALYVCGVAVVFCAVLLIFPRLFPTDAGFRPVDGRGNRHSADSPHEAIVFYSRAIQVADLEAYVNVLARESRADLREFMAWNSRCSDVDTNLELEFVKLSSGEPEPPIPGRAFNMKQMLEHNEGTFEIIASRVHADGRVELTVKSARQFRPDEAEEKTFTAVKEDDGWKLVPPEVTALALAVPHLKRYVEAKESVLAKARAGQFKKRQEAVAALSDALRPEATVSGSPEEALARYNATRLAGDMRGHLDVLTKHSREYHLDLIANSRRQSEAYKAYFTALNERFGYDPGSAFFLKPFDDSFLLSSFIHYDLVGKAVRGPDQIELQLMMFFWSEAGSHIFESSLFAIKENGVWQIGGSDPEDTDAEAKYQKGMAALRQREEPRIKMLEQLTADVRAGKYPDRDSERAAYREASERLETKQEQQ